MDEVMVASLDNLIEPNLEEDAHFFTEEEDEDFVEPELLDEL
jgi:hypothetical protein